MKAYSLEPLVYDFRFPHLDTLLRLEVQNENITIHASRDSFSTRRKELFIRELAAEGFIPDAYLSYCDGYIGTPHQNIRWVVDFQWLTLDQASATSAQRATLNLLTSSVLLFAVMCGVFFAGSLYNTNSLAAAKQTGLVHGSQMARR